MDDRINKLRNHIKATSKNEQFIHHKWFVKYHLEIVEKISLELCELYPDADRNLVVTIAWLHDYGKILDFDNQYEMTQKEGFKLLLSLEYDENYSRMVVDYIKTLDNKIAEDLALAPIEVQIVSSADAASHFVGPFFALWWYENSQKPYEELMEDNLKKIKKDWERKMVLPEVKNAFQKRYEHLQELNGMLPDRYLDKK